MASYLSGISPRFGQQKLKHRSRPDPQRLIRTVHREVIFGKNINDVILTFGM